MDYVGIVILIVGSNYPAIVSICFLSFSSSLASHISQLLTPRSRPPTNPSLSSKYYGFYCDLHLQWIYTCQSV